MIKKTSIYAKQLFHLAGQRLRGFPHLHIMAIALLALVLIGIQGINSEPPTTHNAQTLTHFDITLDLQNKDQPTEDMQLLDGKSGSDELASPLTPVTLDLEQGQTALSQTNISKTTLSHTSLANDSFANEPLENESASNELSITVRDGDVLSLLFDQFDVGQSILLQILSADESLLALETLRPGHQLIFRFHEADRHLKELELYRHAGSRVIYRKVAPEIFEYETLTREGQWSTEVVSGTISGSFYLSAKRAGLTDAEIVAVTRIFSDQLDFSRMIQKGDAFQIVRSVQMIEGELTGQSRIDSARVIRRKFEHTAFLFDDGRYYDKKGQGLARAFTRTPLSKKYRVSSRFNPRRVHPVTGRVAPHNGTDFATPTGTKVMSTGDGVVARVGNHRFAGRYVDIQHGGQYKTRYLHLHKVLVRKGQGVKRGELIALSGNTGRSTGPHLHFELHVNGRPVDPMKAKIPLTQSVAKKDKASFSQLVATQTMLLNSQYQYARQSTSDSALLKTSET